MNKQKSQKGQCNGKVGAPQKPVKIPNESFTIARAIRLNKCGEEGYPCELTVRKRITAALKGFYMTGSKKLGNLRKITVPITHKLGEPIPQPAGKAGRPAFRIVPVGTVVKAKTAKTKPVKTVKTATVVNVNTPAVPAPTPDVVPTPAVTTPAVVPTVS